MAKQYLDFNGLALYDSLIKEFINSQVFIGTYAEYETANANGEVPINALVFITDDEVANSGSTTARLGYAVLGQMILGQT